MRIALGLLVLGVAVWLSFAVVQPGEENLPAAGDIVWTSSAQCAECHQEVYDEWKDSWHAKSWIDEDVRVQSNDFANKDCIDCHAPQPVFTTGIANRVLPRSSRREEGVDCLSCHLRDDGTMAATVTIANAPCKPVATIALQRVDFCATCHNQHKTVDQWRDSKWVELDQDCVHCHMPFRGGDPTRGRIHTMAGGHDMELVRSAVELRAERLADGSVRVELENTAGGHAYPTDERSRASDLFWRPQAEPTVPDGWRHLWRIRDPYRYETHIPSTLLHAPPHPDSLKVVEIPAEEAQGPIEVALYYKLTPYYRDPVTGEARHTEDVDDPESDAQLVHRVVVP